MVGVEGQAEVQVVSKEIESVNGSTVDIGCTCPLTEDSRVGMVCGVPKLSG